MKERFSVSDTKWTKFHSNEYNNHDAQSGPLDHGSQFLAILNLEKEREKFTLLILFSIYANTIHCFTEQNNERVRLISEILLK